jgi:hypothetical protein
VLQQQYGLKVHIKSRLCMQFVAVAVKVSKRLVCTPALLVLCLLFSLQVLLWSQGAQQLPLVYAASWLW